MAKSGFVYKRKYKTKQGVRERWYCIVNGKWIPGGDTRKEAVDVLHRTIAEQEAEKASPVRLKTAKGKPSTLENVLDEWYDFLDPRIESTTLGNYQASLKPYRTEWGYRTFDRITHRDLEFFITNRLKKIKVSSVQKEMRILRRFLRYCLRHQYILQMVTDNIVLPRGDKKPNVVLDNGELKLFVDGMKDAHWYGSLWLFMLLTGLRESEAFGLRQQDINYENKLIKVRQQVYQRQIKKTKTINSIRDIDMSGKMETLLRGWKPVENPDGLVWTTPSGTRIDQSTLSKIFHKTLKDLEIPRNKLHILRHTNVALRIRAGQDWAYIAHQLGDSIQTIIKTYAHLLKGNPEFVKKQTEALDSVVG
jgi:integrase